MLPSPAPDDLSDTESDIITILEGKRKQIEEEIEAFNMRKEKEFKAFEDELRSRKRQSTNPGVQRPISELSNLCQKDLHSIGSVNKDKKNKLDEVDLGDLKLTLGPGKPIVSVERVTINGLTTPPVTGTPPLLKTLSRSPPSLSITPPCGSSGKESGTSPTVPDRINNFHGLFTPAYLPLLDMKPSSLPQESTSPPIIHTKCSLTACPVSSNSLPSALRATSGTTRRRKRVTFRLAHSVVVEPSSSYEETTSPSEDRYEKALDNTDADSAIDILSSPWPPGRPLFDLDEGLTSPNKNVDDGNFFSLDEELEEVNDSKRSDYQKVSHALDQTLPGFGWELIGIYRLLNMTPKSWMRREQRQSRKLSHPKFRLQRYPPALYR